MTTVILPHTQSATLPPEEFKTSPKGRQYRCWVVKLSLLPKFFEERPEMEPRAWFNFEPENDYVLGIGPREKEEENHE